MLSHSIDSLAGRLASRGVRLLAAFVLLVALSVRLGSGPEGHRGESGSHGRSPAAPRLASATGAAPAQAPEVPPTPPSLEPGASGVEVEEVQRRLTELAYDPGPIDGVFSKATELAVIGMQKVHGLEPTGRIGPAERAALASPVVPDARRPDGGGDRVEVDLTSQLLSVYRGDQLALVSHISTGNGERFCVDGYCRDAVTPVGDFKFLWQRPGWDNGPLGGLYNAMYFMRDRVFGIAVHGANEVPLHPASHGCIRIPLHTAERFPSLTGIGTPIYVTP